MTIVSVDAAYCYNRVNHVIMSLAWLVLANINIPAIIASLILLQTMKFFNAQALGNLNTLWVELFLPIHDGVKTRKQSGPAFMDPAERSSSYSIQAAYVGGINSGPNLSGVHSHNGRTLCGQHRSIQMERAHHGPQRTLVPTSNRA
jgi:hypothetical protein